MTLHRIDELNDGFISFGKLIAVGLLRVDKRITDFDVIDATAAFDKLSFDAEDFLDFCRQTGGSRKVVSLAAVFDRNLHIGFLVEAESGRKFTMIRPVV